MDSKTKISVAVYGEDFVILACVMLTQYWTVTDGRTDASKIAKTREALHAVALNDFDFWPMSLFSISALTGLELASSILVNR